jgi:hypothetical protein
MFTANCHCVKVRIEIPELPNTVISCNCSICRRYGALWAHFTRDQVRLDAEADTLCSYRWGDRTIDFWHCTSCGCVTHYTSIDEQPGSRFVVNARMLSPDLLQTLPVRHFDGAHSWTFLD